ncbi:MAG: hypothetical protein ACK5PD_00070 [Pirellulaceae bacterium]
MDLFHRPPYLVPQPVALAMGHLASGPKQGESQNASLPAVHLPGKAKFVSWISTS